MMSGTKRRYEQLQPQLQRDIVHDYRRGVRGHGYIAIAQKHQLPVPTIQSVIARTERAGGNLVAPRGHKKRKLNSAKQAKLCSCLDRNPFATNQQLRARVGNKIAASTVSRYLARAKPRFTVKVAQDQEPEELYANEALHKGRSRVGKFDQGHATRPGTHCTFTQRKIACCTGTCQTKTQTLRRSNASQWMQQHR